MQPIADTLRPAVDAPPAPHRWTVDEYYRMAEAGLFNSLRVELIEGQVIEMNAMGDPHARGLLLVEESLRHVCGTGWIYRTQMPLRLSQRTEPEPDLAVIRGAIREQPPGHPSTADLVVEVADTSLHYDRTTKLPLYAAAGVPEYWILNLVDRKLEVYHDPRPAPAGSEATYRDCRTLGPGESVNPLIAPGAAVRVADLLP